MADSKISGLSAITINAATDEFVVAASSATKKITQANLIKMLPGYELGYKEITTDFQSTATSAATATAAITMDAIVFDGTPVIVQFNCSGLKNSTTTATLVNLWEDSTDKGILCQVHNPATSSIPICPAFRAYKYTPAAGSKVLTAKLWVAAASTGTIFATSTYLPAYMRVVRA